MSTIENFIYRIINKLLLVVAVVYDYIINDRILYASDLTSLDMVISILCIDLSIEATRKAAGFFSVYGLVVYIATVTLHIVKNRQKNADSYKEFEYQADVN